jgi:hypothetical protein
MSMARNLATTDGSTLRHEVVARGSGLLPAFDGFIEPVPAVGQRPAQG